VTNDETAAAPTDPFGDLEAFADLPRVGGHWLSRDGRRVVVGMATRDTKQDRYVTGLWDVDPRGARPARRLTRSAQGESGAAFTPSGDLLFVSARPDPDGDEDDVAALWLQPAGGGDAKVVANPPGGVRGVVVGENGTVVVGVAMLPSAADTEADRELRTRRKDGKVSVILHEEFPVRFWNHDLGPDRTRLFAGRIDGDLAADGAELDLEDITGHVASAFDDDCTWDITPDGSTVVVQWAVPEQVGSRHTVVAIDVATGDRTMLADDPGHEYETPRISPDGRRVAMIAERRPSPDEPNERWVAVVDITGGDLTPVAQDWDRWPETPIWTPDGTAVVVHADDAGRSPAWRIDVATGEVTRLTPDHGAYTDLAITPDGRWLHAGRSAMDSPVAPVRIALDGSGTIEHLLGPAETLDLPGILTEVTATGEDGTPVRAWLAVPHGAGADAPAPLILKIHGGPTMSANKWSWLSSTWVYVSHGYAVLMPDPALSTGYGQDFIRRGWGAWGGAPYTDLMRITDAALERDDIDATRTGALGASFGGYMANWIAGHTDRFAAIVTHASVWHLNQSMDVGDVAHWFRQEMTYETAEANSPHHFADAITTPMLVTHGDKDYRVPIGEGMKLWWDLSSRSKAGNGSSPHKFLYYPTENHFVTSPNHNLVWHEVMLAFFDHHVRGMPWRRPDLLG
jgi:dipeptidyl aminopeptidase/acylaminoacyl peptidase